MTPFVDVTGGDISNNQASVYKRACCVWILHRLSDEAINNALECLVDVFEISNARNSLLPNYPERVFVKADPEIIERELPPFVFDEDE
jgi:hypothetical protein